MDYDIIIGGAGITGLYAGLYFVRKGFRVLILERSNELGGRIQTIRQSPSISYEAGAGRFNNKHVRLIKLLRKYRLEMVPISQEKQYISVTDSGGTLPSPSIASTLQRVIAFSKNVAARELKSMSFEALCKRALGDQAAQGLKNAFGYNAEFELMNAYDALRTFERDFDMQSQYYYCKGGLSQLIHAMHDDFASMGGKVALNESIRDVQIAASNVRTHVITSRGRSVSAKCVILTFPQSALLAMEFFTDTEKDLLQSAVEPVALARVYAVFRPTKGASVTWFQGTPKTSTDLPLRQVIPINPTTGLIMASYSDTNYAKAWADLYKTSTRRFKTTLVRQLEHLFPERAPLPPLQSKGLFVHYWPEGVHVWKVGADSSRLYSRIMQIKGPAVPVFIIGETYSKNQGWIEGGLDMFHDALPKLRNFIN